MNVNSIARAGRTAPSPFIPEQINIQIVSLLDIMQCNIAARDHIMISRFDGGSMTMQSAAVLLRGNTTSQY
eukprot:scaffold12642_cov53-Cyclotella_meneghiniana.AAC.1